jgi:hypothetical protein
LNVKMSNRLDDIPQAWRYVKELPTDNAKITKALRLLESYTDIAPADVGAHVEEIVRELFPPSIRPRGS